MESIVDNLGIEGRAAELANSLAIFGFNVDQIRKVIEPVLRGACYDAMKTSLELAIDIVNMHGMLLDGCSVAPDVVAKKVVESLQERLISEMGIIVEMEKNNE